jgi:hypothetical protein
MSISPSLIVDPGKFQADLNDKWKMENGKWKMENGK